MKKTTAPPPPILPRYDHQEETGIKEKSLAQRIWCSASVCVPSVRLTITLPGGWAEKDPSKVRQEVTCRNENGADVLTERSEES